jgi:SRSO17 transposase
MDYFLDSAAQARLEQYFGGIGVFLFNKNQRASFALYALGLLGEAPRKSVEPIAAQLCPDPDQVDALHQRLQHFLVDAPWSDREVRREAARYALQAMTQQRPLQALILDDTGFLKQGKHSVGVQRQYTGSAGKVANCQIGVSLSAATATAHVPIDFDLYLPQSWIDDPALRKIARIPTAMQFRTKPQMGLQMLEQAIHDGVPPAPVLADSGFGDNQEFRSGVRSLGLDYAVGIHAPTKVVVLDRRGHRSAPLSARQVAEQLGPAAFKKLTWREGTKKKLQARFAFRRVLVPQDPDQEPQWLVMEWSDGERAPSKFYLSTVPARTQKKALIRLIKERYRTEQIYEELKGELGLDHYEGRRYPGWHHHISAVLCCYSFVVAERERHFPPCARGTAATGPQSLAA